MNNNDFTKYLPETEDIECQVLSDLINAPENMPNAIETLRPWMFGKECYKKTWATLVQMFNAHEPIDLTTVYNRIDKNTVSRILNAIDPGSPTIGTCLAHCTALIEASSRRLFIIKAADMINTVAKGCDLATLVSLPKKLVGILADNVPYGSTTKTLDDVINSLADELQGNSKRIPTGIKVLDGLAYGGLKGGWLVILSARPSIGKSAIAIWMLMAAAKAGFRPMLFSTEMDNEEVVTRMLLSTGLIKPKDLATHSIDWQNYEEAARRIQSTVLFNDRLRTIDEIISEIVIRHEQGECDIAFIDQINSMALDPKSSRYEAITNNTAKLKQLARQLRIPIVLVCQANRSCVHENRPPELYDLKESGSIEQDSDLVLMLEKDSQFVSGNRLNIWVRKFRNAPKDLCIKMEIDNSYSSFHDVEGA